MKKYILSIICVFVIAFLLGGRFLTSFQHNLVDIIVYKSFSQENMSAISRQRVLTFAATLLGAGFQGQSKEAVEDSELPMLPAIYRGLYYRRLADWENAGYWYRAAAQGEPIPELQQQVLISPWMELAPTGNFILEDNVERWSIRADSAPGSELTRTEAGTLVFSCSEIQEASKIAALQWKESFIIPYHHTLILRAKANTGTRLDLETVIDGQLVRHLTHEGTGEWQDFEFPVEGNHVKYIYVLIREDTNASAKSCQAEIDSITFLLDETIDNDHS